MRSEDDAPSGAPTRDSAPTGDATAHGREGAAAAPFIPTGSVLAGRFRIQRFVARGGMGEIYEAEDLELRERVALKTIRPEIAGDEQTARRFKREVQLARRVTDPSVCRIHDWFTHAAPSGPLSFVTMEFLEGETLAQRLARGPRFSTVEALPLAAQMAGALDAAHRAGIVHRDFKPGNVMLVAAESGATRAVVTDFGLARPSGAPEDGDEPLTTALQLLGTPSYMAPEQVEGRPVTAQTDVYAFGIVLYRMLTGTLPFAGDTPMSIAARRLVEPPTPPSVHLPGIDGRWEAVILRCLERDPARRFASAGEAVRALEGEVPAAFGSRRVRRVALVALVMLLVICGVTAAWWTARGRMPAASSTAAHAAAPRRAVAVLGFRNLAGRAEAQWLSTALAEMLTTGLGAGGGLRTIPGESVARMKRDLDLADADSLSADTLARIARHLGNDVVVLGSYLAQGPATGGRLRVDLRVQDLGAGGAPVSIAEEGTEDGLLDLVGRCSQRLREALAVGAVPPSAAIAVRAALPSNTPAARLYAEGLARLRSFDAPGAQPLLVEAVRAEPSLAVAHAALAMAWQQQGYDVRAAEEAKRALELSAGLPAEQRGLIEGGYHVIAKNWPLAVQSYQALMRDYPDEVDYGVRLADAQISAGQPKEALVTTTALRRRLGDAGRNPQLDRLDARAYCALGDFRPALAATQAAAREADARGGRLLVGAAKMLEGEALAHLGEPQAAVQALEAARTLFESAGDRSGVARALSSLGVQAMQRGDLDAAIARQREALAIHRSLGDQAGAADALNKLGSILRDRGDHAAARAAYDESLAMRRTTGNLNGQAGSLGNIANLLESQGDLAGARALHEQSLAIHRQISDQRGEAIELTNMAVVDALQGRFSTARTLFEEALTIKRRLGNKSSQAFTLQALGDMFLATGDLAAAERAHGEALAIREALGERVNAGSSRLALAAIHLEQGRVDAAESEAAEVLTEFHAAGSVLEEVNTRILRSRALIGLDRLDEAQNELRAARTLFGRETELSVRTELETATAQLAARRGSTAERTAAARALTSLLAETVRSGNVGLTYEVRLALARLELAAGRTSEARTKLETLEREASVKGFGLIARKAAATASAVGR